jgi:hypothetical protein
MRLVIPGRVRRQPNANPESRNVLNSCWIRSFGDVQNIPRFRVRSGFALAPRNDDVGKCSYRIVSR